MSIGFDLSLRSTGVVVLDEDLKLIDFCIISQKEKEEELLDKNELKFINFLFKHESEKDYIIEGLSFGSLSGSKDILYGNYWGLRMMMYLKNHKLKENYNLAIYPVLKWRNGSFTKETLKHYKENFKNGLKEVCVNNLPEDVKISFINYLFENKLPKNAIYDLSDAYFMTRYHILTKQNKLEKI